MKENSNNNLYYFCMVAPQIHLESLNSVKEYRRESAVTGCVSGSEYCSNDMQWD
ncbi:MAG: hypothetical protein ILP10_05600 [Lachnospiraceae bacterium]|nr:hypothetical protein [Lachnospiraceae bacterium]